MGFNQEQWISPRKLGGTMINGSFMDDYTYDIPMTNDDFMGVEWVVMMIHLQT